jgi:hypothetical protein
MKIFKRFPGSLVPTETNGSRKVSKVSKAMRLGAEGRELHIDGAEVNPEVPHCGQNSLLSPARL